MIALIFLKCFDIYTEVEASTTVQPMTFTLTGQSNYGPERLGFRLRTNNTEDPKAIEVVRWVLDPRGNWYQCWSGFHFVGNARGIYRDRIKAGWVAA